MPFPSSMIFKDSLTSLQLIRKNLRKVRGRHKYSGKKRILVILGENEFQLLIFKYFCYDKHYSILLPVNKYSIFDLSCRCIIDGRYRPYVKQVMRAEQ